MDRENAGVWLKGNLHMHTGRSDGRMAYEEAVARYERGGYDFIAVTDHWRVSERGRTPGGMLLLPGCEYDVGRSTAQGVYHIVGVGMERAPALQKGMDGLSPQRIVDAIRAAGGEAILAHPAWSLNSPERVREIRGLAGTEIYNATSGFPRNARPYSGLFVDRLAALGTLLPCIAADDTHMYEDDLMRGYIMVRAQERTQEAVMAAIRAGDFYATQGPEIHLTVEGGVARVTCSPASHVVFYSDAIWNDERATHGEGITKASCRLLPHETFVRAEVIDSAGRAAYSSPVAVRAGESFGV